MPTDIDKLHKLIKDLEEHPERCFCRQNGKTTLQLHQLAGQIMVGNDDRIIVKIKFERDLGYLWPMIKEIFAEQGINITLSPQWNLYPQRMDVEFEGRQVRLMFFRVGETSADWEMYKQDTRGYNCMEFSLIDY